MRVVGIFLLLLGMCKIRRSDTSEFVSPSNIEGNKAPLWYSRPYRIECSPDCTREVADGSTRTHSDINKNANCSSSCSGDGNWIMESFKRKRLKSSRNSMASSVCMIGIAREDISCELKAPQPFSPGSTDCRRRNFRYYLPKSTCKEVSQYHAGEETCQEACTSGNTAKSTLPVDTTLHRAIFRPCYKGRLKNNFQRIISADFCRAELVPCSRCFKWENWTATSECSRTCGSPGFKTYTRRCLIMERSATYGETETFEPIESAYCKAFLGGQEKKTGKCGMHNVCPQWTDWSSWSACEMPKRAREGAERYFFASMRSGRKRRNKSQNNTGERHSDNKHDFHVNVSSISGNITLIQDYVRKQPENLEQGSYQIKVRTRVCLAEQPGRQICQGNSTQSRPCDVNGKQSEPITVYLITEDGDGGDQEISTAASIETSRMNSEPLKESSTSFGNIVTTGDKLTSFKASGEIPKPPMRNSNDSFTVDDEGGFTFIINNYAPILITALLIFIVLLLFALIVICGSRLMQQSRNNRYDVTPPSFSAGTMRSIPSGLVNGFSHVLGLRQGSGTFGRSEYAANASDAISSRGSCRSLASNATYKGRIRSQQHQHFTQSGGVTFTCGSLRHQTTRPRISLAELQKHQIISNEPNMGSKKPSNSSLLSSASSAAGTPINSCSFHPLPPIPPDPPSSPSGNDRSVFKRGTCRSSSLNPEERERKAIMATYSQPRAESVSGRLPEMPHLQNEKPQTPPRLARGSIGRRDTSSEDDRFSRRGTNESQFHPEQGGIPTENEYWSVTREDEQTTNSASPNSQRTVPRAKFREKKRVRRLNTREAKSFSKSPLRVKLSQESADESNRNELVDNVLYGHHEQDSHRSDRQSYSDEPSPSCNDSHSDYRSEDNNEGLKEEPFYNAIEAVAPDLASGGSEPLDNGEDDYDHLCSQFSSPKSPKVRSKFFESNTLPRHSSSTATVTDHDYESIELNRKLREDDSNGCGEKELGSPLNDTNDPTS